MTANGCDFVKLYLIPAYILITGCSSQQSCQTAINDGNYVAAVQICQSQFSQDGKPESLTALITALGELAKIDEIKRTISNIQNDELLATAMLVAASYAVKAKNVPLARKYYTDSADIFRQMRADGPLAKALQGSFRIAWRVSNHRAALTFAAESLDAARKAKDNDSELVSLTHLFIVLQEVGSLEPAQHVVSLIEKKLGEDSSSASLSNAHTMQGLLNMDKRQFGMAAHNFEAALTVSTSTNSNELRGMHLNAVNANIELARLEKAKHHMAIAWGHANKDGSTLYALRYYQSLLHFHLGDYDLAYETMMAALNDPDLPHVWAWEMYHWAGKAAAAMGVEQKAIELFIESIRNSESLREGMEFDQLKAHLLSRKREPYEAIFIEYVKSEKLSEAFEISEQAKSRSFIEAFIQTSETDTSIPDESISYLEVSDRVDSLQQYLGSMQSSPIIADQNIDSVMEMLGDKHLISYFLANQRLFILKVTGQGIVIKEVEIEFDELLSLVHSYRETPSDHVTLAELGSVLFPDWALPEPGKHIYVSPDGFVGGLALSSLKIQSKHLIERNIFSMVPSANALVKIVNHESFDPNRAAQFTVIGDPGNDLPAARQEALEIANLLKVIPSIGRDASFSKLLEIKSPEILHLATHSGTSHLGPWLRFSAMDMPATAILRRGIKPKLAMLASCGSGALYSDNLWGSLGGAFLSSGTPSIIVTLWSVEDQLTREMTRVFYMNYLDGSNSADALAMAQRWAIKQGKTEQQWGAFMLLGIPGTISENAKDQLANIN